MLESLWQPSAAALQFASDDLDEIREHMDGHNGAHWRHARRPGSVGFRLAFHAGSIARFAWCQALAAQTIRGSVFQPTAHLTLNGRASYRVGRRDLDAGPGDLVLLPAHRDVTIESDSIRRFALQVPEAVAREAALSGALRLSLPGDSLMVLQGAIRDLLHAGTKPTTERVVAQGHAEARLADWMHGILAGMPRRRASRLAPVRVRHVEEWIDAHLQEPISLARLAEVAGVRPRCLQLAFESRRHQSPMDFVAERRLAAAHAALAGGLYDSVTGAASAFGFEHAGRFATKYRRLFGLAPSETLRRRRARA